MHPAYTLYIGLEAQVAEWKNDMYATVSKAFTMPIDMWNQVSQVVSDRGKEMLAYTEYRPMRRNLSLLRSKLKRDGKDRRRNGWKRNSGIRK